MSALADILRAQREAIIALFTKRVRATVARADALSDTQLVDHLPKLLDKLARATRAGTWPPPSVDAPDDDAAAHAHQRLTLGYDLDSLVREYGVLRDCLYQQLGASADTPDLSELRVLSTCLFAAIADSVNYYVSMQQETWEGALRASEQRYRTLFESIDDGFALIQLIFAADGRPLDYRFLETNAAFEQQTGIVSAVGKTARELVPDLDETWFELYGRVATTGEPTRFTKYAPAMNRWFEVYASRTGSAELRQVVLVFKDVSERKRAESERERLLALESAARKRAEEASLLKDEFLATVSHELRTPLSAMLGWMTLLRTGGLPPDKYERALETVERNARAQAKLIEDLLDVSRILTGKLRIEAGPVDLRSIAEAAIETIRPAANARDLRVQAVLDSEGMVMGDSHRLQQVVWNLLSNAVKFTPKGGRVKILLRRNDSSVELSVSDTGQGIAESFQAHVFERFRQEDGGTTRAHGGLGLGLSIVRQLVELHGGNVSAFSEGPGKGATFVVQLPIAAARRGLANAQPSVTESVAVPPLAPVDLRGLHVLVVDDEKDARELLRTLLEAEGARVSLAASASEGLQLLSSERPGVLVSDIGMPHTDGYALIDSLRRLPPEAGGDVPAIALTAYARSEDRTRALLAGFDRHLPKPVEAVELYSVIASLARERSGA